MRATRGALHTAAALAAAAALATAATGCGSSPNTLEGSVSAEFDLAFESVEVDTSLNEITVRYLEPVDILMYGYHATNSVAEISLSGDADGWVLGEPIDVTGVIEVARYVMVLDENDEIVQDDREFPEIYTAEATFDAIGETAGEPVAGHFRVIFIDGSTLRGSFEALPSEP